MYAVWWTHIVGITAAAAFFLFGILFGIGRKVTSWFEIKNQEDSNRKVKSMLHSISDYKAAQIDRLSAYKAAKIDKLSAFKNSKIDRLHNISRPSFGSALHHMQGMREHYSAQIDVIKGNCAERTECLRDNYTLRVQRFRDYRSIKVGKLRGYKTEKLDNLRDNYSTQAQKIRDYGSQQMNKLRRSYKLQQHYMLKLYELLDINNCRTFIEAECMRTESMLFDEDFMNLDLLAAHPVHMQLSDSDNDSYYVTASSQSDNSISSAPQHDDVTRQKANAAAEESSSESSDNLGVDEMKFDDIEIQPYPSYLNFLESIEIESETGSGYKPRKGKSKSIDIDNLQLCFTSYRLHKVKPPQVETKSPDRKCNSNKSTQRRQRSKCKRAAVAGSDSDSENEKGAGNTSQQQRISSRKFRNRSRHSTRETATSISTRAQSIHVHKQHDVGILLRPADFIVDTLRDDDVISSQYESAMTSNEVTPTLSHRHKQQQQGVEWVKQSEASISNALKHKRKEIVPIDNKQTRHKDTIVTLETTSDNAPKRHHHKDIWQCDKNTQTLATVCRPEDYYYDTVV